MKSMVMAVMVAGMFVAAAQGGITNDLKKANELSTAGDYDAALAAFQKVLADYPEGAVDIRAGAQISIGHNLMWGKGKYAEAQAAYEQAVKEYPTATIDRLSDAQYHVGRALLAAKQFADAQGAFEKVLTNYPGLSPGGTGRVYRYLGAALAAQERQQEAQVAYMAAATEGANTLAWQQEVFGLLEPYYIDEAVWTAHLRKLLMIIPATNANAEFLGRIKSQLDVLVK